MRTACAFLRVSKEPFGAVSLAEWRAARIAIFIAGNMFTIDYVL